MTYIASLYDIYSITVCVAAPQPNLQHQHFPLLQQQQHQQRQQQQHQHQQHQQRPVLMTARQDGVGTNTRASHSGTPLQHSGTPLQQLPPQHPTVMHMRGLVDAYSELKQKNEKVDEQNFISLVDRKAATATSGE